MTHPATTNSTLTSNSVSYRGTALRTVGRAWSTRPRVVEASSLFSPSWTMAISRCNWHHLENFCRLFVESALTQINQMLLGPGICRLDLHQLRLGWAAPSSGRRRGRDGYRPSGDVLCPIAGFCQRRGAVSTLRHTGRHDSADLQATAHRNIGLCCTATSLLTRPSRPKT